MKLKKIMKTFVVCFALVVLLTLSCFATSAQTTSTHTTSTTSVYGHYISPGEYMFNSSLTSTWGVLPVDYSFNFSFTGSDVVFSALRFYAPYSLDTYDLYFVISSINDRLVYREEAWTSDDYRFITVLDGFYIYDVSFYQWWQSNVTRVSPGYDSNLLDGFFSAFAMIGQWISGATSSLTTMFWANNSLTFLGTLAVSALAFAVVFLIVGLISRFLKFRG